MTTSGIELDRWSTKVSGPGQNVPARRFGAVWPTRQCTAAPGWFRHVNDEGIESRPSLGVVNSLNGGGIGRDTTEAVDGFGRESDQPSAGQHVGGVRQVLAEGCWGSTWSTRVFTRRSDLSIDLFSRRGVGRFFTPGLEVGFESFIVGNAAVVEPAERPRRVAGQGIGGQQRQGDGRVGVAGDRVGQAVGIDLAPGHRLAGVAPERPPVSGRASVIWRK